MSTEGLDFNENTAQLTGTPTEAGEFNFTVSATNSVDVDIKIFTLTISNGKPQIIRTTLSEGSSTKGVNYSDTLLAKGFKPIVWSLPDGEEKKLPRGLTLSADGKITGIPEKHGTYKFNVTATNDKGSDTAEITIKITGVKPTITNTLNDLSWVIGEEYSFTPTTIGAQPITYTFSGTLPDGLKFDKNTGTISGTATGDKDTAYSFTLKAENDYGANSQSGSIWIYKPSEIKITTEKLPMVIDGEPYNFKLQAEGDGDITWTIDEQTYFTLHKGLTLAPDGTISGKLDREGQSGYWSWGIIFKASNGTSSAKKYLWLATSGEATKITLDSLLDGVVGKSYYQTIYMTGYAPVVADIVDGELPEGMYLTGANDTGNYYPYIVGTPKKAGTYNFKVRVAWASGSEHYDKKEFTLVIHEEDVAPKITEDEILPEGSQKIYYSKKIKASGTDLKWLVTNGKLPSGLSLNYSTGIIYGTPSTTGTFNFDITATNSKGSDKKSFTLVIGESQAPTITTASLNSGTLRNPYSATIEADGAKPITFSLSTGALPTGLTLNSDGTITGTPTEKGNFNFAVTATNAYGENSKSYTIEITGINSDLTLGDAIYKQSYKATVDFDDTTKNTQWKISDGKLPKGLSITKKGIALKITGKPSEVGTFVFTVTGTTPKTKTEDAKTVSKIIDLRVLDVEPKISTSSLKNGTLAKAYSKVTLKASKCYAITWNVEGLPNGLEYNAKTGVITGTPLAAGDFEVKIIAKNYDGVAVDKSLNLKIKDITIKNTSLKNGTINKKYSVKMNLSEKPSGSVTWSAKNLPNGLEINSSGTIAGTPTEYGTFNVKVTVSFSELERTKDFELVIKNDKPTITTKSLAGAVEGDYYSAILSASDSNSLWSWSGKIPSGLNLSSNGVIYGTPEKSGSYSVKITAANTAGKATKSFTLKVAKANTLKETQTSEIYYENSTNDSVNNSIHDSENNKNNTLNNFAAMNEFAGGSRIAIGGEEYLIIAEFDNLTVTKSGQYEFVIELDKNAPVNFDGELFWFANPVNSEVTEDDFIADFYDGQTGNEIFSIPESNLINVNAWLNAEIIYKPVLAIKLK